MDSGNRVTLLHALPWPRYMHDNIIWTLAQVFISSPTVRSAVLGPKAQAGEGTNLDMRGVHLHAWWLGWNILHRVYIYIYKYLSKDSGLPKYVVCKLEDWYVVDQTSGPVKGNRFGLFWSFFVLLHESIRCLHQLNTEASKWFKISKQNGCLGACGWFRLWGPS